MNCTLERAAKLLCEKDDFIFLCHVRPDGDTVGSAYALKYALEAVGKTAEVLCADVIPQRLRFVTELQPDTDEGTGGKFVSAKGKNVQVVTENAVKKPFVCAIDVAETHLLGENKESFGENIGLKIDHHGAGAEYAKYNYIDSRSAACGEIIYKIVRRLEEMRGGVMDKRVCTALYTAISSDTGCFKYSNVTSSTMRIAAELIDGGADNYDINHRLFELKTKAEMEARRYMLNNTEYYADGRLAFLSITNAFREESGASDDDIGGLVSEMREIEGVEVAINLKQDMKDPKKFKISMRSGLNVNVSELCKMFGGGGHTRAAGGAIVADSPELAKAEVLSKVLAAI